MKLGGVKEAAAIRTASLSGPVKKLEPLNLFHLRDALRVSEPTPLKLYNTTMEPIFLIRGVVSLYL